MGGDDVGGDVTVEVAGGVVTGCVVLVPDVTGATTTVHVTGPVGVDVGHDAGQPAPEVVTVHWQAATAAPIPTMSAAIAAVRLYLESMVSSRWNYQKNARNPTLGTVRP